MVSMFRWSLVVLGMCLLPAVNARADTVEAASCDSADVQAAVDMALDGDIVAVPPGSCPWSSGVTLPNDRGITLMGAGVDSTTISESYIVIDGASGRFYRITGFTLDSSGRTIMITGTSRSWRVDHNTITGGLIYINGCTYGVIDHNQFVGDTPYSTIFIFENPAHDGGDGGAASWGRPLALGTADAVYVEDNLFDFATPQMGSSACDGRSGARWVMRYNTVKNINWASHDAEISNERGTFSFELYGNTFIFTTTINTASYHRGGSGVIWGNRFMAVDFTWAGTPFIVRNSRSQAGALEGDPWGAACDGNTSKMCLGAAPHACVTDADCTAPYAPPCVQIDGVEDSSGYPCRDQFGRSTDDPVTGAQALAPVYEWDNYYCYGAGGECNPEPSPAGDGMNANIYVIPECEQHIQKDRDFFEDTQHPSYTPFQYPHPLTQESLQPCADLGGTCCGAGQDVCQGGSFQPSSDCVSACCIGGTCAAATEPMEDAAAETVEEAGTDAAADTGAESDAADGGEQDNGNGEGCSCAMIGGL